MNNENENKTISDPTNQSQQAASALPQTSKTNEPVTDSALSAMRLWTKKSSTAQNYINNSLASDIAKFKNSAKTMTGYANMDKFQPLYPGLYVIGAISSIGKTTFIYQMADQIAAMGNPVIYFSAEQPRFELFTKSIARYIHLAGLTDPSYQTYTAIEIRQGDADGSRELAEQSAAYARDVGHNLTMIMATMRLISPYRERGTSKGYGSMQTTPAVSSLSMFP